MNNTHHQAVAGVVGLLKVAVVSAAGLIEGQELKSGAGNGLPFLLTVQFHPECLVNQHAEHRSIFHAFTQACGLSYKRRL